MVHETASRNDCRVDSRGTTDTDPAAIGDGIVAEGAVENLKPIGMLCANALPHIARKDTIAERCRTLQQAHRGSKEVRARVVFKRALLDHWIAVLNNCGGIRCVIFKDAATNRWTGTI